jgi:hypothetical protein
MALHPSLQKEGTHASHAFFVVPPRVAVQRWRVRLTFGGHLALPHAGPEEHG